MVNQTAWRGYDDVRILPELDFLLLHAGATDYQADAEAKVLIELLHHLVALERQLSGRRHNQDLDIVRVHLLLESFQEGQSKGRGLATARYRARQHIPA